MAKTIEEITDGYAQLAQDFADHLHERAPSQAGGKAQAKALALTTSQVVVVWLPVNSPLHFVADVTRFIDDQRERLGIAPPVIVTIADDVTVQDA